MKRYGIEWEHDGDAWRGTYGRFTVCTWEFGAIHQCKVFVHYPKSRDVIRGTQVGICLEPCKTRDAAMKKGIAWCDSYEGPPEPEALMAECFDKWRTLFRTRLDVLDHWFCTVGNGYEWLDGGVVSVDPESKPLREDPEVKKLRAETRRVLARVKKLLPDYEEPEPYPYDDDPEPGPEPDDGKPHRFYPMSQDYSLIFTVPDDVRPEWLKLAWEAGVAVRDRATEPETRAAGAKALEQLATRFWIPGEK